MSEQVVQTIVVISIGGVWALAVTLFIMYVNWSLKRQARLEQSRDQADEWLRKSFDAMTLVLREATDKMARLTEFLVGHEQKMGIRHDEIRAQQQIMMDTIRAMKKNQAS